MENKKRKLLYYAIQNNQDSYLKTIEKLNWKRKLWIYWNYKYIYNPSVLEPVTLLCLLFRCVWDICEMVFWKRIVTFSLLNAVAVLVCMTPWANVNFSHPLTNTLSTPQKRDRKKKLSTTRVKRLTPSKATLYRTCPNKQLNLLHYVLNDLHVFTV